MTRDQAKESAKRQLESYLQGRGINTKKPFRCLNPSHEDKNPSMSSDSNRDRVHCFGCGADYDILALIAIEYNIHDDKEMLSKTYEVLGIRLAMMYGKP